MKCMIKRPIRQQRNNNNNELCNAKMRHVNYVNDRINIYVCNL